jgi:drug/metabolite transporter (DMT)-like permease
MLASILTTILFALSTVFASRSAKAIGGLAANFWRLVSGVLLLGLWAHLGGEGLRGAALPVFLLSGVIGFGVGDTAYFQALRLLGPRLCILMTQCLAAPIAAVTEWVWLGRPLGPRQILFGAMTLAGVALAVMPRKGEAGPAAGRISWWGLFLGILAAAGQGIGAVLSRKAYGVAALHGESIGGVTAAYQRILGGLAVGGAFIAWRWWREWRRAGGPGPARSGLRGAWGWVLANAVAGSVLGVSCYQWALRTTEAGVVLPIVATAPIVIIPFLYFIDGEKPTRRSVWGAAISVAGVAGLIAA